MRDAFSEYHPLINFIYFVFVIGFTMFFVNPVCLAVTFFSSVIYSINICGVKAVKFQFKIMFPVMILTAVINPAFSHAGITVITYFPNGNPLTLESIIYGIASGVMLASVLCWFLCLNKVMSSDKVIYLFGRAVPGLSLVLSMTLRFIPGLKVQLKAISDAQKCLDGGNENKGLFRKIKRGLQTLSILVTWALENSIDTADSMRSRAYGIKGRTSFSLYRFSRRDAYLLLWMAGCGIYIVCGAALKAVYWQYYPVIKGNMAGVYSISVFVIYLALCLTPVIINICEERRWKTLKSEI